MGTWCWSVHIRPSVVTNKSVSLCSFRPTKVFSSLLPVITVYSCHIYLAIVIPHKIARYDTAIVQSNDTTLILLL